VRYPMTKLFDLFRTEDVRWFVRRATARDASTFSLSSPTPKSRAQSEIPTPPGAARSSSLRSFKNTVRTVSTALSIRAQNDWREGSVETRRVDDRIRELCNQARVPQSAHELLTIITDLESALRERSSNRPRKSSAVRLVVRESGFFKERRSSLAGTA
jgi:hypothetical protein